MAERTTSIRPKFYGDYSEGWAFCLPKAFQDALDIKYETRKKDKLPYNVWAQGENFDFRRGDVIYDSKLAYELEWGEAVKRLKYTVMVVEAEPAIIDERQGGTINEGYVVFQFGRFIGRDGTIDIERPLKCTQAEFVQFLETGFLTTDKLFFDIDGNLGPISKLLDENENGKKES